MAMREPTTKYVIVGAGLSGGSAVDGIRERDKDGSILLLGNERHLPYDRPPLSKKLWFGKKKVESIFLHDQAFYAGSGVDLVLDVEVEGLDPARKTLHDNQGNEWRYHKLLLATGGIPNVLDVPGAQLDGVSYYRYLDDYTTTRAAAAEGKSAVVIGGGFIGSEMAAALRINKLEVTMVFPGTYLGQRVFPEGLGRAIQAHYLEKGVRILAGDAPTAFEKKGDRFVTTTRGGQRLKSDLVIVGVGIKPATQLAAAAGLEVGGSAFPLGRATPSQRDNGIVVNEFLQTSNPDIYAAGDNALFPYLALKQPMRVEHWDNAVNQGKHAGANMAGAGAPYAYMPYFYSDLFEFGYEAVGDINTSLETVADWQQENVKGVIYYLKDGAVRGAMMCDVWEKVEAARELIRRGARAADLKGAIR
jgi:NAD(P)H-nitrite reductase large subunit